MRKNYLKGWGALFFLAFILIFPGLSMAQTTITGRVIDTEGQPVAGATVSVPGTTAGAGSSANGTYSLTAPSGATELSVSAIGYTKQTVTINGRTTINFSIKSNVSNLNEVVVTGYAAQKKKDIVGAVAVVNVAALTRQPTGSIENQLQGEAAGVTVVTTGQPGEAPAVKIRGANTFGNNQPLYVVDGIPTSNISDLNPADIQSMQVLKDAGSASIYGARAANGVIVLTTKRGNGKVSVTYDGYYGTQVPKGGNVYHILTPTEMMAEQNLATLNTANRTPGTVPNYSSKLYGPNGNVLPDYINPAGAHFGDAAVNPALYNVNPNYPLGTDPGQFYQITQANKSGTDWFHAIFKQAPIQNHSLSLSGSSDQATYFFSLNYYNQQGTLINTYDKRYAVRANTTFNVGKHIRVGENLSFSVTENPQISENNEGSAIGFSFREQPIIPVYDIKGNFAGSSAKGLGNSRNPVAYQYRTRNNDGFTNRVLGNVFAEADIAKYFTLRTVFGGEYYSNENHNFTYPEYENSENNPLNAYSENSFNGGNYTWTNTLTFHRNIAKNDIRILVGTEAYTNRFESVGGTNTGYFSFDPNYTTLSTGSGTPTVYSNTERDKLFSYIGRLDYSYADKYLLNATIRRDGSSRFLNKQYGWFPAVSLGWRLSQEEFLKSVSFISDLKIRGSYGIMGNQINVSPSNGYTTFAGNKTSSYYDVTGSSSSLVSGFAQQQIGNPNAQWELDKNLNVGFDGSFFNSHLEISADYYNKNISKLLFNPALPGIVGSATPPFSNVASMKNTGLDLMIATHENLTHDLRFDAALSLTTYKNEILQVTTGQTYFDQDAARFNGNYIVRNQVGGPVGGFFGYKIIGFWNSQAQIDAANASAVAKTGIAGAVYQTDAAVGRFKYADVKNIGQITAADRTFLGNPNPKFTAGLNLGFEYKHFDLNMFLYASIGNKIWDDQKWWTDFYANFQGAKSKTALYDSWTPTHMNAKAPIQEAAGSFSTNTVPNSYYVEDGSFLRMRNLQIGYTFEPSMLKRIGVNKLRVYLSGANLFTITKYSGVDPEITSATTTVGQPGSSTDFGIDRGNYAPARTYLLGVQLKF